MYVYRFTYIVNLYIKETYWNVLKTVVQLI